MGIKCKGQLQESHLCFSLTEYEIKLIYRTFENEVPLYVSDKVKDNRRKLPNYAKVLLVFENVCMMGNGHTFLNAFQQHNSYGNDGTYDAYEKDIAVATFYFEEPMVFEYTRHVKLKLIS